VSTHHVCGVLRLFWHSVTAAAAADDDDDDDGNAVDTDSERGVL